MRPLPDDYQARGAAEKQQWLWDNIRSTEYDDGALPTQWMPTYMAFAASHGLFSMKHLRYSFEHESDEIEGKRAKIVHTHGSVCRVVLEPEPEHPFTGLFRSGAVGLVRIGQTYPGKSFTHGMAFKFFIDGRPSANAFSIPVIMGQGDDCNVFGSVGSNRLTPFHGVLLTTIRVTFSLALKTLHRKDVDWDRMIVRMMAASTADGAPVESPSLPWELVFEPTPEAQVSSSREPDYRIKLKGLAAGTPLYHLSGRLARDSELISIGTIRSTGEFIASSYGDEKLFFQHDPGNSGLTPR